MESSSHVTGNAIGLPTAAAPAAAGGGATNSNNKTGVATTTSATTSQDEKKQQDSEDDDDNEDDSSCQPPKKQKRDDDCGEIQSYRTVSVICGKIETTYWNIDKSTPGLKGYSSIIQQRDEMEIQRDLATGEYRIITRDENGRVDFAIKPKKLSMLRFFRGDFQELTLWADDSARNHLKIEPTIDAHTQFPFIEDEINQYFPDLPLPDFLLPGYNSHLHF